MQRSGTHALCVKLTGSHLPVLPVLLRAYCIVYGGKNQAEINFFIDFRDFFVSVQKRGKRGFESVVHHTAVPPNFETLFDILT